ncbi:MAG TPA: carbon storage regulator [Lacipirellulaceae bacterium]|nr:carbon storage regulator [Lacipirellulaceae bacterium]HMP06688.1 carbon storage regulator [Lacipirellulaceae bacterium]
MIVISRGVGDAIRIAEDIVVQVEKIEPYRVALSIEAPRSIPVLPGEAMNSGERDDPPS